MENDTSRKRRQPRGNLRHKAETAMLQTALDDCRRALQESEARERILRSQLENLVLVIDNSDDEIVQLDADGTLVTVNKRAQELFGYENEDVVGKKFFDLPPSNRRPREQTLAEFAAMMHSDHPPLIETEFPRKDGTTAFIEVSPRTLKKDGSVVGMVFTIRDVSERKKAEDELQELYKEERRVRQQIQEEMKRRGDFTRALAHELKTPLTPVLASIDMLTAELKDPRLLGLAENIGQGAATLERRVDELLDLARGEVGMLRLRLQSVDVAPTIREAADKMAPLVSTNGQSLVLHLPSHLPKVRADVTRIEQVITNLLHNATKFTPKGGKITLAARPEDASLVVEVKDTGSGMSKRQQEVLFEPYAYRDKPDGPTGGLGLGLTLCKLFVELHGGQIWARSRLGKGSTFGFSLPIEVDGRAMGSSGGANKLWKLLIVEDDPTVLKAVLFALEREMPEARSITVRMGAEAIDLVESEQPDAVILDLGLPDIDGLEVIQQVRMFSAVPIIVLSVRQDEQDISRALSLGADDYVTKPFKVRELIARLNVQLRGRTRSGDEGPIVYGPLRLDPSNFELKYGGRDIGLTVVEGNIMKQLMISAGHVVPHDRLAEAVWGEEYPGAIAGLRTYIRHLRRKLEEDPRNPRLLLTKVGVGYSLAKPM